jgi:hypothetical protein
MRLLISRTYVVLKTLSGLSDLNRHDDSTRLNDLNSLFGLRKIKITCTLHSEYFPCIKSDLDSLNNLTGLNVLDSLISSKKILSLMFPSTLQPK